MRRILLVGALAALVVATPAGALLPEQRVRATPQIEFGPAAARTPGGERVLAWSASPRRYGRSDVYVKVGSAPRRKVNLGSRLSAAGGLDWPRLAWVKTRGKGAATHTDIRLYDIETGGRSAPPTGVNTPDWELAPTLSGDWFLFERGEAEYDGGPFFLEYAVVLHNAVTHEERELATTVFEDDLSSISAGQVAGDYAVFSRCGFGWCRSYRYTISTGETVLLRLPPGSKRRDQGAPAVTSTGIVYTVRSTWWQCRRLGPQIARYFGSGDPATGTVLTEVPAGISIFSTFASETGPGRIALTYDRRRCGGGGTDLYRLVDRPD